MNKLNLKPLLKRTLAYMIDILIVVSISTLITNIPIFSKNYQNYQKEYNQYQGIYNDYNDIKSLLEDSYKDQELSEEEINKLYDFKLYEDLVKELTEKESISNDEYNDLLKEIDKIYLREANIYNYNLQKLGIYNSLITLIITFIYFGVIQYLLKGQTVGKRLLNLRVISANNRPINIFNYILRCLIINNVFLNGINLLSLSFLSKQIFLKGDKIISILVSIVEAITIYLVIIREDHRGLHDLICNTKVIDSKELKED